MSIRHDRRMLSQSLQIERERRAALRVFKATESACAVEALLGDIGTVIPGFESLILDDRTQAVSALLADKSALKAATESVQSLVRKIQLGVAAATVLVTPFAFIKNPILAILGVAGGAVSITALHLGVKAYEVGKVVPYVEFENALKTIDQYAEVASELSHFNISLTSIGGMEGESAKLATILNKLDMLNEHWKRANSEAVPQATFSASGWDAEKFKKGMTDFEHVYNKVSAISAPMKVSCKRLEGLVYGAVGGDVDDDTGIYEFLGDYVGAVDDSLQSMDDLVDTCKAALKRVAHKFEVVHT